MKALEKAAKDRGEARTDQGSPATVTEPRPELSLALELLAADTPSPRLKDESPSGPGGGPRASAAPPLREQKRAATSMQAGGGGVTAFVRARPLVVVSVCAALFAAGFGIYVYLQIYHPALFITPSPGAGQPSSLVQAPTPAPPPPATVVPPIPASTLLESSIPEPSSRPTAPPATIPAPAPRPAAAPVPQKAEAAAPRNTIVVSRGSAAPAISAPLAEAYAALQAGRLDAARELYGQLVRVEPQNVDALLGLAAIATQEGRTGDATKHYLAILELDPRHALAQSGLIGLMGRADPLAAETRLKQIIAREPSAFLYFTLGNLYADQSLWAQAQQAYFQAHHRDAANPDYAYNLAVGLEHLDQPRLALDFYRRAVELASARGHANFNSALARERIGKLAAQSE
ncbi:MAG: tetratricopeptide repeat protein [Betaproteobacteria bacterium]|nr:tetratricopeptide repeat protein [Betaproteobacteria bacterium]